MLISQATKISKFGETYDRPATIDEQEYYNMMEEFIDLAKIKGLTVRQAQKLFADCADAVLSTKL